MIPSGSYHSSESNLFTNYSNRNSETKADVRELEFQVNKLELVTEALWRLLKQHTELTETDLIEMVSEIDLEDGRFDGKKAKKSYTDCPKCKRRISKDHPKCFYCGEVILRQPFE